MACCPFQESSTRGMPSMHMHPKQSIVCSSEPCSERMLLLAQNRQLEWATIPRGQQPAGVGGIYCQLMYHVPVWWKVIGRRRILGVRSSVHNNWNGGLYVRR